METTETIVWSRPSGCRESVELAEILAAILMTIERYDTGQNGASSDGHKCSIKSFPPRPPRPLLLLIH